MPKKVDHEARRQEIVDALWRIAGARGLDGVSLRDVAAEADISLGRLQHYFRTKDDMLTFACRRVSHLAEERIRRHLEGLAEAPTPYTILRTCLTGMLPLDDNSRTGALIGVAHFSRAVHDERLSAEAREGIPNLAAFFADQLRMAATHGDLTPGRDPATEAELLISLVDGLGTYTLLGVHSPERAVDLLDAYLEGLFEKTESDGGKATEEAREPVAG
ncbi:TetR/AcrR family transcriptional regulator [Streptomyces sp. MST-110588]|uniref:TetR/AcrR family transcriptional regulator n=1 Tax=Streptomyces sp. MST-110588 TaxID=2833628 RepID=UPI001F5D1B45|nr:TetR/AcrR family transcriptional regulator [Streptomyces sp. MST-110588]UNO43045.1 TetR/AcrR family transcriptional regulator [Streptomyces sp. MST-110588]